MSNDVEELDRLAVMQAWEEKADTALSVGVSKLILGKDAKAAFFATLVLKIAATGKRLVDWDIPTLCTDGKNMWYNPGYVCSLDQDEVIGVLAHEVMHPANLHHVRRGERDPVGWNIACDLAINQILLDSGFKLPQGACVPGQGPFANLPKGLSAEEYYGQIPKKGKGKGEGEGEGKEEADPGKCGGVKDPGDGSDSAKRQAEAQAKVDIAQANTMAQQRGQLPGGLQRIVADLEQAKVDWRDALRQFVNSYAKNDYTWTTPNRRYLSQGIYLPGLRSEELGELVLAVDTSGSIRDATLRRFASEIQGMLEAYDCTLTILFCDAQVHHVQTWRSSDGPIVLEAKGGGGTSHRPVWEWIQEQGRTPTVVVCLTDMETDFGDDPGYPVLWANVGLDTTPPFGAQVRIE